MSDSTEKKPETTYPTETLVAESRGLLGVASHVAVGALHGSSRKELSVKEAKERVEKFQGRKAKHS